MPAVAKSVASLRIFGDELIPEEITERIGCEPTWSYRKGDVDHLRSGKDIVRKTGMWLLEATATEPEDLNLQVKEVISRLTSNLDVWKALNREFEIDLYCGLFLESTNDGLSLSAETLAALGERGVELGLQVYAPTSCLMLTDACPCKSGKKYGECCAPKSEA